MTPEKQIDLDAPLNADELDIDFEELRKLLPAKIEAMKGPLLKNGIKPVHEAFADFMLINPSCTLRQMQAHFGYSPSWICQVINCDMFEAYFNKRRRGVEVFIAQDLPSKLAAAAHLATERVIEIVTSTSDPELIIDAFDKILHRHGFAPNAKGMGQPAGVINNTQNVFYLDKNDLANAREKLIHAHDAPALPAPVPA